MRIKETLLLSFLIISVSYAENPIRITESLEVASFVPPDRSNPKRMPALVVDGSSQGHMKNGKRLQIFRAEASTLPDLETIRQEIAAKEAEEKAEPARLATEPEQDPGDVRFMMIMGATVFEHRVSHVTIPDGAGIDFEAVCGFDIGLLSGISGFSSGDTEYSIYLTHGDHIADRDGDPSDLGFPPLDVAEGAIVFTDKQPHPEILADLETLRELIANEKPRLVVFQEKRRILQAESAAWNAKNPIPPKDETIWFRPHEGSRYLAPDAAKTRGNGGVK